MAEPVFPRWTVYAASAVALVAVGAVVGMWVLTVQSVAAQRWDPIDDLPDQKVVEVTSRVVVVEATKCYSEPVDVVGSFSWQSVEPRGTVIMLSTGTREREAGCVTERFENPIPAAVLLEEADRGPIVWRITGTELPVDAVGGRLGVVHVWRTDPFQLEAG